MAARVRSTALIGIDAAIVDVETQVFGTLRKFSVIGLPDGVLRESKERVRCAIENSGFPFPDTEVIVNLAPAALPKTGSGFDLAIALSILAAAGCIHSSALDQIVATGELALDGALKPIPGVLASAILVKEKHLNRLIIPQENAREAAFVSGLTILPCSSLAETVAVLNGQIEAQPVLPPQALPRRNGSPHTGFDDVVGQHAAKRALEIAAAGGHNVLMSGPPGSGKTMLAQRLTSILPPLSGREALEATKIYSAAGGCFYRPLSDVISVPPFRSPHHSTSLAGLIGGGSNPTPGEISLAHHGVLFLDELPEFRRDVLEALRQPLESKKIVISRSKMRINYPADFLLIAAMNPCPCGKRGTGQCRCSSTAVLRYAGKISGPLLDRIDLQVWVPPVPISQLSDAPAEGVTEQMRCRVTTAREKQLRRHGRNRLNARLSPGEIRQHCSVSAGAVKLLERAVAKLGLTARSYNRVLKVARTIADLGGAEGIEDCHIAEAISYRIAG